MLTDQTGYQCANGVQLAVVSCFDFTDQADCAVVRVDLPPVNGFPIQSMEKRGVIARQVASCTARRVTVNNQGMIVFVP